MELSAVLALYDQQQRIEMNRPEARKEVFPDLVRFVRPAPGMNVVQFSALDPANADASITAQIAYFLPMGQPFEWIVCDHDKPADLGARLVRQGFLPDDEPSAVMLLDLENPPASMLEPVTVDIREITRREQLADVIQVLETVYGGSFGWVTERLGRHMEIPDYLYVYVAYAGGYPASVAWLYCHPNGLFADLWGGSTVAEQRKKGLYTALLATRVQKAIERGFRFLVVNAGPESQPIVASHGFQLLTTEHSFRWGGVDRSP